MCNVWFNHGDLAIDFLWRESKIPEKKWNQSVSDSVKQKWHLDAYHGAATEQQVDY